MVTGLVTVGAVALTAAPASAHTADVRGTAECVDGQYVVAWTVTNNDKDNDATLDVAALPEKSKLSLPDTVQAGETVEGTQVLPPGSNGIKNAAGENVARLAIHGVWKDGDKVLKSDVTADVPLPGPSCRTHVPPPSQAKPSADATLSCDEFAIELVNPTKYPVRFTVAFQFDQHKVVYDDFLVHAGKKLVIPDDTASSEDTGKDAAAAFDESDESDFANLAVSVFVKKTKLASDEIDYSDCESASPAPSTPVESASASPAPVAAAPSVSPAASSSLPVTGASLGGLLVSVAALLGLGVTLVVFTRRRKRA